ncbi:hypothetical protein [Schaalia sp. JY-X169]|uniref:hypothetical protein n=1 Tax=Schaalia sp. JY-X169 TaxID=2758572 RepID=UPI0015F77BCB|nr:hypothetical protein [Schaalia sp. JY-X169]
MELSTADVLAAMCFAREDPSLRPNSARTTALVRIDRGAYLDPSLIPIDAKPWEIERTVTKARCHALARRTRRSDTHPYLSTPILTGEAAMVAAGAGTWDPLPAITFRDEVQPCVRSPFPAARLAGKRVPPVRVLQLASTPSLASISAEFQGIQLPAVPLLVADLARTAHPVSAYANICTTFSRVTEFDNRDQGASRARESALRTEILQALSPFDSTRAIAQIRALIARADAGAGSVWQGGFLWMLHCWLKPSISWESQYHVSLDGMNYYCDAAIPEMKISLEFEGTGKLGQTEQEWRQRSRDFLRRAQSFSRHGWTTVRLTAPDFRNVEAAMWTLGQDLDRLDIARRRPGGPLWKPLGVGDASYQRH